MQGREASIKLLTANIKAIDHTLVILHCDWENIFIILVMDKTRRGLLRMEIAENGILEIKEDYLEGPLIEIRTLISAFKVDNPV